MYIHLSNESNQVITDVEHCDFIRISNCSNIRITGGALDQMKGGVFITDGSSDITIEKMNICAARVGIYLNTGTHHNHITKNVIHDSGRYLWLREHHDIRIPLFGLATREGIAIDDSWNNIVCENTFDNCALAGVTTYRNCDEHAGSGRKNDVHREHGANDNTITYNTFNNMKVGIWNRARQYRDLTAWCCGRAGKSKWMWELPKLPYQQYIDWTAPFMWFEAKKFFSPVRLKAHIVPDKAENNVLKPNRYNNVKYPLVDGHL